MTNYQMMYQNCSLCPRLCGADRTSHNNTAYCKESAALRIGCACIHRGEEPVLNGKGGSGTIFVSGCNLGCVFCQNHQISTGGLGAAVDTEQFADICLALQTEGAENINIVTGSHAVPAIVEGIAAAKRLLLNIPVLWNSSGYELPKTLEMLTNTVDVFMPDLKTLDSQVSTRYFNAPDYPDIAKAAIQKMIAMRPIRYKEKEDGFTYLVSGVMVRHLVLPGYLQASREVLRWFADQGKNKALLSLMFQYTPLGFGSNKKINCKEMPNRYLTMAEYETVMSWLAEFGIENGYCQELVPGADWLPDFERPNPFPPDMAVPVWHWRHKKTRLAAGS